LVHTENVTERKKNELELKKLSNAVAQTADSVVITDKKGVIEYVNPAFEEISGYHREEAIGQTPRILQSGEHDSEFYKNLWYQIKSGKPYKGTIINKKKNGELFWTQQTITPMRDSYGHITNFVSVLKDITELREKQEQEFQLKLARKLQQRLYDTKVSVPGFDIAGSTFSAVETNGDYFDFFTLSDGSIGLAVGDVCGHGLGSALIMAQLRAYLRAFVRRESDPAVLLTLLNQVLTDDLDESHYVTLILARLDPQNNSLDYANAGHVPGFLLKKDGTKDFVLESTGIPLGFLNEAEYTKSHKINLSSGHVLVLLTDGITETQSPDETEFGYDRVLDNLHSYKNLSANKMIEGLYQAVRSFSKNGQLKDDMTSIICKVKKRSVKK
jgi:sigma-B regulation protein RsbU (phosphoserine phosphatase)